MDGSGALNYFGETVAIDAARRRASDTTLDAQARARAELELAWLLRQRDTAQALVHAAAAEPALRGRRDRARLALVRAEAAWLLGDATVAEAELEDAEKAFAACGDGVGLGDVSLLRASMRDQGGGGVVDALDEARVRYEQAGDPDRLRLQATLRACLDAISDPALAEACVQSVQHHASGSTGLMTYVEGARATAAWRHGDMAAAIEAFQRAFDAAQASGQRLSAITVAQNLGIAFSVLGDHEGALQWVEQARAIVQPTGWPYATTWCLMQTGSVLLGLGRAAQARELLLEGMPRFEAAKGTRNHVLACQVLAEACLALEQPGEALRWSEQALHGARQAPFVDLEFGILRWHALALSRLGRAAEAAASANRLLERTRADGDARLQATAHHVLAQIALEHGRPGVDGRGADDAAVRHLQAALGEGAKVAGFRIPAEWLQDMSRALDRRGDAAGALAFERQASQARDEQSRRRSEDLATALLARHRIAQALADAERERAERESAQLRAELEQQRLQTMLVHSGKLVAIGRLAAGVVHEMSHPVGTMTLLARSLSDQLPDAPAPMREALQALVGESERLRQFVLRLRHVARAEPLQCAPHTLRSVVDDARPLFAARLGLDHVAYVEELPEAVVLADPQRLGLALANLVLNAADALAGRDAPAVHVHGRLLGDHVEVHIDDNGPGLPQPVRERMFEPFYTTRPAGLGLGLTLATESMAAMGGTLEAGASPSGGARLTMTLRVAS